MASLPKHVWTPEEYIAFERSSDAKHEYFNGEIYDMTGASREHNIIVFNVNTSLGNQLKGRPCEGYSGGMRVKAQSKHYTYPDVVVVCGDPIFEDIEFDTLLNPTVIIEVLSPSTEIYDRTSKFMSYRALKSLQEYLLIAQNRPHIEHYARQTDGTWLLSEVNGLDASRELRSIQCTLAMRDVYDKVTLDRDVE